MILKKEEMENCLHIVATGSAAVQAGGLVIPREEIIAETKKRLAEELIVGLIEYGYLQFEVNPAKWDSQVDIVTARIRLAPNTETGTETGQSAAPSFNPRTVGLCGLEWMAEPLSGYGGTEVEGRWYYTQDEALEAARRIGHGWRLPTKEEFCALAAAGSTWIDKGPHGRPGCWFGGNHDTDHKGSVFYEASGFRASNSGGLTNVGASGYAWSSSPSSASSVYGSFLGFSSSYVNPESNYNRSYGFPVRLVKGAE